jgi:hypothetical protein
MRAFSSAMKADGDRAVRAMRVMTPLPLTKTALGSE